MTDITAVVQLNETVLKASIQDNSPAPGITPYEHSQASASFTWIINHNLGYRPSVELFDSGSQVFDGYIAHPSVNQAVVELTVATAGFARLL